MSSKYAKRPPFIKKYNSEETHALQDCLDYAISNIKNEIIKNPEILNTPSLIFVHIYRDDLESDDKGAGYVIFDVEGSLPSEKEIVSDLILNSLILTIGTIHVNNGFIPTQFITMVYWLIAEKDYIPINLGIRTSNPSGYYSAGIVQVPKIIFTEESIT